MAAAARITKQLDRTRLDAELVSNVADLWAVDEVQLYQVVDGRASMGRRVMAVIDGRLEQQASLAADNDEPLADLTGAEQAIRDRASVVTDRDAATYTLTFPVYNQHGQPVRLLLLASGCPELRCHIQDVEALLALYQNHLNLIEDSELDALTGLRNRRTFDHLLTHLLAGEDAIDRSPAGFRRETRPQDATGNWLAVLDIDRFKNINDRYGHLFGDEVLILVANLMHQSFRAHDPLFRFGGEEFVVLLCGVDRCGAESAVDRFRANLESQVFPQVGQITISGGLTEIAEGERASEILNRADAALYYAKQHGRNRTCCYEQLLDDGLISPLGRSAAGGIDLF
jgi:diguanylate cyclase (GGDEF)-like protein